MRPMSAKRRKEQPARREVVRLALERDNNRCQYQTFFERRWRKLSEEVLMRAGFVGCCGPLDVHEIIPRSAWAKGYLELSNVVVLCRNHHDFVGDNPEAAHVLGLHKFSWERPDALVKSQVAEDETGEAA